MLHLITGGSASGKSLYGEEMAVMAGGQFRYYLATMRPWGAEGQARVLRHRLQRSGKGFHTIEVYRDLEKVALHGKAAEDSGVFPMKEEHFTRYSEGQMKAAGRMAGNRLWEETVILLECMSNLTANEMFETGGTDEEISGRIRRGVRHLQDCAKTVIVITNEVFSDGGVYEAETMRYLRLLGRINQELAELADQVTEVVYGIAVLVKR